MLPQCQVFDSHMIEVSQSGHTRAQLSIKFLPLLLLLFLFLFPLLPLLPLATRPTIKQLQNLQYSGGTIKVIEGAASRWKQLGYELDFSEAAIENIECNGTTVEDKCMILFERWLGTPDPQKVITWESLCRALENIELSVLAADLRKALSEELRI